MSEQELSSYIVVVAVTTEGSRKRADVQIFDPENPDEIKEPISKGYYVSYGSLPDVGQAVKRAFNNLGKGKENG